MKVLWTKKIRQPFRTKKYNLRKKNQTTSWDQQNHATTWAKKKLANLLGQYKNHATLQHKKHATSQDNKCLK
jgi:hypothetical protein